MRGVLRRLRRSAPVLVADQPTPEPPLVSSEDRRVIERARPYTMTSDERLQALIDAVRYCELRGLPGAFAECGVWRGGSVLTMILVLQEIGVTERDIYLFDTFEGMTAPGEHDTSALDPPALETWTDARSKDEVPWSSLFNSEVFDEAAVRELLTSTGYPAERLHFVRGPVEETLPQAAPDELALLRLDTDWYESTRHELEHLWPRLADGGVLIVDDYGHWDGARRAVDEYFASKTAPVLLNRIDYTGRLAIKH
jgi:O-methyltransferase